MAAVLIGPTTTKTNKQKSVIRECGIAQNVGKNCIWSPFWYYPGIRLRERIKITKFIIRIIDLLDERYVWLLRRIKLNAKVSILRGSGVILSVCNAKNLVI
jgi:hypothetical protein